LEKKNRRILVHRDTEKLTHPSSNLGTHLKMSKGFQLKGGDSGKKRLEKR